MIEITLMWSSRARFTRKLVKDNLSAYMAKKNYFPSKAANKTAEDHVLNGPYWSEDMNMLP